MLQSNRKIQSDESGGSLCPLPGKAVDDATKPQNLLVIDDEGWLAERTAQALNGYPVNVEHSAGLFKDGMRLKTKPGMALVSARVLRGTDLAYSDWEAVLGVPLIWVEDGETPLPPCGKERLLPEEFTTEHLLEALDGVAPGWRSSRSSPEAGIVAHSGPMRDLLDEVEMFAPFDANVLVLGETGTGKERIARALHQGHPQRSRGPFVAVNCGAIPDGLFESLFMGHAKGAFTNAVQRHSGYFEQANGGTLFLDEIGDLPLHQQVKLLRVIEERQVLRLGSNQPVAVDFRLVAATNCDLERLVRDGGFRADLFYRLAVVELTIPNVDERGAEDKLALFLHFFSQAVERHQLDAPAVPGWVRERIWSARYPGNVRQLQNLAERLAILVAHRGNWDTGAVRNQLNRATAEVLSDAQLSERERILEQLEQNDWHRRETAAALGISRKSLWEKMRRYGIQDEGDSALTRIA